MRASDIIRTFWWHMGAVKTVIVKGLGKVRFPADMTDDAIVEALKSSDEMARLTRMQEQGYTRGMWRGGKKVADGAYYTPDRVAAEDFARRHGGNADVREYAIKMGNSFDFHKGEIKTADMAPIVAALDKNGMGKLAKEIHDLPDDYGGVMPAKMLYHVLDTQTGGGAANILRDAGYDTLNAGQEIIALHNRGTVRDANKAMFDPKKLADPSPFASIALPSAIGLGAAASLASPESQASERRAMDRLALLGQSVPRGTIQAAQNPLLGRAANALLSFQTPIDPLTGRQFQNTANLLQKFNYGDPRSYMDYFNANLELMP